MSRDRLNNRHQRNIYKRIIVKGTLVLDTPTCLGSGNSDSLTDLALLRDSVDEDKALLTGASIAGALRNYLYEYNLDLALVASLFGAERSDDQGDQSPLIVNDSISTEKIDIELRDGVKIDGKTGTAATKAKYDFELLSAGTQFPLFFELLIEKKHQELQKQSEYENNLKQGLAIALSGFEKGEIAIGMKKRRGFGRCKVDTWQAWEFDLRESSDRLAWLNFEHWHRELSDGHPISTSIATALDTTLDNDQRDRFTITATFSLVGSMLIRSGQSLQKDEDGKYRKAPDDVHLKSYRSTQKDPVPVISGTSLAGVLRHRAVRIVNTLEKNLQIVDDIFGTDISGNGNNDAKASKLIVHESEIKNTSELVQTRIAIDRFTGSAMHGALFDAQPVFSGEVKLKLELRNPKEYEIGLLLLLLKDLWTGDLPIGGESSIGRGRLQGICADITYRRICADISHEENKWTIQGKDGLPNGKQELLEDYVQQLVKNS